MATTDDGKPIFDSARNQDVQEGSPDSVTISHNGRSATVSGKQLSMLGAHPEMDEHTKMVQDTVKQMASQVIDSGEEGEFTSKTKLRRQFVTRRGVVMDGVLSIQFSAKPAKPEKG